MFLMVKSTPAPLTNRGHVEYNRRNPVTGGLVHVGAKFAPGQAVFYKVAGSRKARQGTILDESHMAEHYRIQGKTLRGTRVKPQVDIHEDQIWTPEENEARRRTTNPDFVSLSSNRRIIRPEVANQRALSIPERMGMGEGEIMMHPKLRDAQRKILLNLAGVNSIDPDSDDYDNINAEYTIGLMNGLRREIANSSDEDIAAFRGDLDRYDAWIANPETRNTVDRTFNSRIFNRITQEGKRQALADIKELNNKRRELRDPLLHDDGGEGEDPLLTIPDEDTPESLYERANREKEVNEKIMAAIDNLDPIDQEVIYRRFGLEPHEEHTYRELATAMNDMGIPYATGTDGTEYDWNDRLSQRRVLDLLATLKEDQGVAGLSKFLKAIQEARKLRKARENTPQTRQIGGQTVYLCTDTFRKSRHGERLDDIHPDGRWVAVDSGPLKGKHLFFFDALTKSHIHQYTRQDGTLVREHDDKRTKKHPDILAHERRHGEEVVAGAKLAHHEDLLRHLTDSGWKKREQSAVKRNKDLPVGKAENRPDHESNQIPETERNKENEARKTSNQKIKQMHEATAGDNPVEHLKAFKTSRTNKYTTAEDDYRKKMLKHFGHEADDSEQHTVLEKDGHQVILGKDGAVEAAGGDPERKVKGAVDLTERTREQFSSGRQAPEFTYGHKANAITHTLAKYPVKYALVDGAKLTTSHNAEGAENTDYPRELQPRDRSSVASRMQIVKLANKLEPELFGKNPLASDGSPIVGEDGMVESGNGRTLAIKMAYESNPEKAKEYQDWIKENASQEFGIDPAAAEGMKMPMIVRVRSGQEGVNRADFAHEANVPMQKKESATQQAIVDGERIDDDLLAKFHVDEDGKFNVTSQENQPFIQGFFAKIGRNEADGLVKADGTPNKQCQARIQAAVFAKIYQDEKLIEQMSEEADPGIEKIIGGLNNAVGAFAKLHGNDEFNVIPDMTEAIRNVVRARNSGDTIEQMFNQGGLDIGSDSTERDSRGFATDYGKDFALAIEKHCKSSTRLGTMLQSVAQAIHNELAERNKEVDQSDFFATPYQPKNKKQVVTGAFNKLDSQTVEKAVQFFDNLVKGARHAGRRKDQTTVREEAGHSRLGTRHSRKADGEAGRGQGEESRIAQGRTGSRTDGPRSAPGRLPAGICKSLVQSYTRENPSGAISFVRQHEDSRVRSYGHKLGRANNHYDLHQLRHYRAEHVPHFHKLDDHTREQILAAEEQVHAHLTKEAAARDGLQTKQRERQKQLIASGKKVPVSELAASGLVSKPDQAGWAQANLFRSLRLRNPIKEHSPCF